MSVNDTQLHIVKQSLPFGGVGACGMGHYHGRRRGFGAFSKLMPVMRKPSFNGMALSLPP